MAHQQKKKRVYWVRTSTSSTVGLCDCPRMFLFRGFLVRLFWFQKFCYSRDKVTLRCILLYRGKVSVFVSNSHFGSQGVNGTTLYTGLGRWFYHRLFQLIFRYCKIGRSGTILITTVSFGPSVGPGNGDGSSLFR